LRKESIKTRSRDGRTEEKINKVNRNDRRKVQDKDKEMFIVNHVSFNGDVLEGGGSVA
jgi:hypothetical protein